MTSSPRPAADEPGDLRHVYADRALAQLPRLLSLEDRNPFSPTYGSLRRGYWLDKAIDFPDAQSQWGMQALGLAYTVPYAGNPFYRQPKVRDWTVAALDYLARVQHGDGSWDEFYPYERGWAGPTAFLLYAAVETFRMLGDDLPREAAARVLRAIRKAARFVGAGEAEEDHLANHHAIASLAVWKAYELLDDPALKSAYERLFQGFLRYHDAEEGWSIEYDGVDPGYLSATVSFLGKVYATSREPRLLELLAQSVGFASYFAYPNGYFAGSIGSRNTQHFYAHGFELLADEVPLAATLAQRMLEGLAAGALVPPEIMPDRYMVGRTTEYLLAFRDFRPRQPGLPPLPYEREPFRRWFPRARVLVQRSPNAYLLANLAKGGVVKLFSLADGRPIYNDCGVIGRLANGTLVSSQWVDPSYTVDASEQELVVEGSLHQMPSAQTFTPVKMAAFRSVLAGVGWSPAASHFIKGTIRKRLMLGTRPVPLRFRRRIRHDGDVLEVRDELRRAGEARVSGLMFGDEFAVRYVPQSRYYQGFELDQRGYSLAPTALERLNERGSLAVTRRVRVSDGSVEVLVDDDRVDYWLPSDLDAPLGATR